MWGVFFLAAQTVLDAARGTQTCPYTDLLVRLAHRDVRRWFCVYSPRHPIICLRWGVQTMRARGVAPDEITYSSAIAACGNSGEAKRAIELLQVRGAGAPRQAALIFALLPVLCWTVAGTPVFALPFRFFKFSKLRFSCVSSFVLVLKSPFSFSLSQAMKADGVPAGLIAHNAAIGACDKGGEWSLAVSVLKDMREAGIRPDAISYAGALRREEREMQIGVACYVQFAKASCTAPNGVTEGMKLALGFTSARRPNRCTCRTRGRVWLRFKHGDCRECWSPGRNLSHLAEPLLFLGLPLVQLTLKYALQNGQPNQCPTATFSSSSSPSSRHHRQQQCHQLLRQSRGVAPDAGAVRPNEGRYGRRLGFRGDGCRPQCRRP